MVNSQRVNRIVKVPNLSSIPGATPNPGSGTRMEWPTAATVLWMMGSVVAATSMDNYRAGMTSLGFKVNRLSLSELVTSSGGADFVQFDTIFPSSGFRFPVNLKVAQGEAWIFFIRNMSAATAFYPDIAFGVAE